MFIKIGNQTLCNSLTASKNGDRKYKEITDLKFMRKMINYILIYNIANEGLFS